MKEEELKYTVRDFTANISTEEYIKRYRDADRFMRLCRECRNYNRLWSCPPFSYNPEERLRKYSNVMLIATQIEPARQGLPLSQASHILRRERLRIENQLLELERKHDAFSCSFTGECLHCPAGECARAQGEPCRHPELVRPSLEAFGFDINRTLSELMGLELLWGKDGCMPKYMTLVSAIFHNSKFD